MMAGMRIYEAEPDGEARGAVIVVMEAFGVNEHIEDVTRRAAAAGYHAVAPDLFHRSGGGTAAYDDFSKVMELFAGVDDEGILADIDATIEHLHTAGFTDDRIGIVGFCFGGRVAFLVATRRALGAAVTFYGGGLVQSGRLPFAPLVGDAAQLATPWLGQFGDRDAGIPVEDVETLRAALDAATEVPHEILRYDADHGFHCDQRPAVYDEAAATAAWAKTLDWFGRHIG
jgi:carboxymethylenebutenolidase